MPDRRLQGCSGGRGETWRAPSLCFYQKTWARQASRQSRLGCPGAPGVWLLALLGSEQGWSEKWRACMLASPGGQAVYLGSQDLRGQTIRNAENKME